VTSNNHQLAPLPLAPNYFAKKKYSDTLLPRMNAAKITKFKMVVKVPNEGIYGRKNKCGPFQN
jgi:hypothetical protein